MNLWAVDYPSYARISGGLIFVEGRAIEGPLELDIDTILQSASTASRLGDSVEMLGQPFTLVGISQAGTGGRIHARIVDIEEIERHSGHGVLLPGEGQRSRRTAAISCTRLQQAFPGYTVTAIAQMSEQLQRTAMGLREFRAATTANGGAPLLPRRAAGHVHAPSSSARARSGSSAPWAPPRGWVVRLLLRESILICLAGIVVGFLLAVAGRWLLIAAFPAQEIRFNGNWAAIAAALGLAGGFLGALYPAVRAARMDPLRTLNFE